MPDLNYCKQCGEEHEPIQFFSSFDFWGYRFLPATTGEIYYYYFEAKDGTMLFGDRLPSKTPEGEKEARQILRAANLAHNHAKELAQNGAKEMFKKFF